MQRAGSGDQAACAALVARHQCRVRAFARRLLRRREDAEDVAQDVFLRVWRAAPDWQPRARFTTWLYRVAANACRDRLAKKRESPCDDVPEIADRSSDPSRAAEASQLGALVRSALGALPASQRRAIVLCVVQDLPGAQASRLMRISVTALESLLARGRRTLRARLRALAADRERPRRPQPRKNRTERSASAITGAQ